MLDLVAANTPDLVGKFVDLPYRLHAHSAHWIPPLRRDERRRFDPRRNPFLEHADLSLWLVRGGHGGFTGRIAGIQDRLHDERFGERTMWFGFFEANDLESTRVLLGAVEQNAARRGCGAVRGPVNPSLNESAGLLVDRFEDDPYVLMPYNPPAYAEFIEAAGYSRVKDLLAWDIDLTAPLGSRIVRVAERVATRHRPAVRTADLRQFERDLGIMQAIYRSAWADNWGFVPPTDAEIRQLALELRPVLDPELLLFAELDGRAVACALAVPDVNQVLRKMRGRLLPFGVLHFFRRRSLMTRARLLLLGVLPQFRRHGLYPLLIAEIHRRAVARGYQRAELSWTLDDNHAVNAGIEAAGGRRYKTYRLYEKPVR